MKKINGKKLALNRETLASLSSDVLADVAGGNASGVTTTITRPLTRLVCPPSRVICPPQSLIGCPTKPNAGGNEGGGK